MIHNLMEAIGVHIGRRTLIGTDGSLLGIGAHVVRIDQDIRHRHADLDSVERRKIRLRLRRSTECVIIGHRVQGFPHVLRFQIDQRIPGHHGPHIRRPK